MAPSEDIEVPNSGVRGDRCFNTKCKDVLTREAKCMYPYRIRGYTNIGCPKNHGRYTCCKGLGRGIKPDINEGSRICTLTECKSIKTKEAKCKAGTFHYGSVPGKCPPDQAQFRCCRYGGLIVPPNFTPQVYTVPKGSEECVTTECKSTKTKEAKCLDPYPVETGKLPKGCDAGEAKYSCCKGKDGDGEAQNSGNCMTTECKSLTTKEAKCLDPFPMEMDKFTDECDEGEAKFSCCGGNSETEGLGGEGSEECITTKCKSTKSKEMKCTDPYPVETGKLPKGCDAGMAKYSCCKGKGAKNEDNVDDVQIDVAGQDDEASADNEVDTDAIPGYKCTTSKCKKKSIKNPCPEGTTVKWMNEELCENHYAMFRCCSKLED
ncbi:uncharacterized protein LOC118438736 [Folsomia candida]|uniref:uncharacterized protein LOC118438736 n=1 Tax=Folsomia candida TaxID=158441 RepID=UPI0016052265|nr:uncharacterized protein LOC118438736 [Folsomia candida]